MTIYKNKHNLPDLLVNALLNDPYDAGDSDISTTSLINPPQMVALKKRHDSELEEDLSEMLWRLMGQCMHVIKERAAPLTAITEKRYFVEVNGWKISGQIDLLNENILIDHKMTSVWTYIYGSRIEEWTQQANINRWLAWKNGINIESAENYLYLRDWMKSKAGTGNYPQIQFVRVPLKLWKIDEVELYVKNRVALHQSAQKLPDNQLPPCSDEERWWNDKKGKFIRCEEFCIAAQKCNQNAKN